MKLRVQTGPLPIEPPYFECEEEVFEDEFFANQEEIDLTDIFEGPLSIGRKETN
jgi:hypothetical protein